MNSKPKVITEAKVLVRIHCGECNWEQLVLSQVKSELKCCPWCGWDDFEISKITNVGAFQEIECEKHGRVSIAVTSEAIETDDFMDNLFCPYCK